MAYEPIKPEGEPGGLTPDSEDSQKEVNQLLLVAFVKAPITLWKKILSIHLKVKLKDVILMILMVILTLI